VKDIGLLEPKGAGMAHLFLSYSRRDINVMHRLQADLQKAGLSVWTDEGIEPGTPLWKDAIEQAIEQSDCLVVILSPDAKQSIWVKRELDYAALHKIRIFPLLAEGEEAQSIPFGLVGSQYLDIRRNYKTSLQKLITAINKQLKPITLQKEAPLSDVDLEQLIMVWIAEEFEKDYGVDLLEDRIAKQRLKEAAEKARSELSQLESTEINLPFIYANETGVAHLTLTLSRTTLENLKKSS
jgi:hypothetical protein